MANENNGKWRSRRFFVAILSIALMVGDKIYCVEKGLDIEWFTVFSKNIVLLALFGASFFTATDLMKQWKKKK